MRADPKLKSVVVFVLTTSQSDRDIYDAYDLNVAGYLVKNELGQAFMDAVTMLESYWTIIEFPHGG